MHRCRSLTSVVLALFTLRRYCHLPTMYYTIQSMASYDMHPRCVVGVTFYRFKELLARFCLLAPSTSVNKIKSKNIRLINYLVVCHATIDLKVYTLTKTETYNMSTYPLNTAAFSRGVPYMNPECCINLPLWTGT